MYNGKNVNFYQKLLRFYPLYILRFLPVVHFTFFTHCTFYVFYPLYILSFMFLPTPRPTLLPVG